jgi:hypothetical protein
MRLDVFKVNTGLWAAPVEQDQEMLDEIDILDRFAHLAVGRGPAAA